LPPPAPLLISSPEAIAILFRYYAIFGYAAADAAMLVMISPIFHTPCGFLSAPLSPLYAERLYAATLAEIAIILRLRFPRAIR